MITRWILHVEAHLGRLPRVSIRRAPRPGDLVIDGGQPGTLMRCPLCQEGHLFVPDHDQRPGAPACTHPRNGDERNTP